MEDRTPGQVWNERLGDSTTVEIISKLFPGRITDSPGQFWNVEIIDFGYFLPRRT